MSSTDLSFRAYSLFTCTNLIQDRVSLSIDQHQSDHGHDQVHPFRSYSCVHIASIVDNETTGKPVTVLVVGYDCQGFQQTEDG